MNLTIILAAAIAGSQWAGAAQANSTSPTSKSALPMNKAFDSADAAIADASATITQLQGCGRAMIALKSDYRAKLNELKVEFHGAPPRSFDDLLKMKQDRIARHRNICTALVKISVSKMDAADSLLSAIEPKSLPGIKERHMKVEGMRKGLNTAMQRSAARQKAAAAPTQQ